MRSQRRKMLRGCGLWRALFLVHQLTLALTVVIEPSWTPVRGHKVCSVREALQPVLHALSNSTFSFRSYTPMDATESDPPHPSTALACMPLSEVGVAMWIGGPPGAGKSTTAVRLRRYGFMALDCEDQALWSTYCKSKDIGDCSGGGGAKLRAMRIATLSALSTRVGLAMGSCSASNLFEAPANVMKVVLLPGHELYMARWRAREVYFHERLQRPGYIDGQNHEQEYVAAKDVLQDPAMRGQIIHVSDNGKGPSCVDASLIQLCNSIVHKMLATVEELCFYCERASTRWTLYPYCVSRCAGNATHTHSDVSK